MECRQLPSLILLFAVLAGAAFAEATTAYCNSCTSCTKALNNASNDIVYLNTSISTSGSCINNPANFSNKIFDCQGHTITGRGSGYGIYTKTQENDTIQNCQIDSFSINLYFYNVSSIIAANITLTNSSGDLAWLDYASNSTFANSTLRNSGHEGIAFDNSVNNLIANNSISNITQQCIEANSANNNTITNNTLWLCTVGISFHVQGASYDNNITYNNISQTYAGVDIATSDAGDASQGNLFAYNTISTNNPADWSATNTGMIERDMMAPPCVDVGFVYRDIGIWGDTVEECNNTFVNNTGTGGLPIYFSNTAVNWSNIDASQILLCNADNSVLNNVSVSSGGYVNALSLFYSDNVTITNSTSNGNTIGLEIHRSENDIIANNSAMDNFFYDLFLIHFETVPNSTQISVCNNKIENLAGSGGYPIYLINGTINLSNIDASEVVLCGANNSVLANITIHPSAIVKNNGFILLQSYNTTIKSSAVSGAFAGITDYWFADYSIATGASNFSNNLIENCSCYGVQDWDFSGTSTTLYNNTIRYSGVDGVVLASSNNTLMQNHIYGNGYTGANVYGANATFINNEINNNSQGGVYSSYKGGTALINNSIYCNGFNFTDPLYYSSISFLSSFFGLSGVESGDQSAGTMLRMANNTIYGNSNYGLFMNLSEDYVASSNDHIYGNGNGEVYLESDSSARQANFTNLTIDNPAGNYQNYTSLDVNDITNANSAYSIKWATNSSPIPSGNMSFRQKFVNITTVSGSPSIDEIAWLWGDSEATGVYNDSRFELWEYNASGRSMLNNTPDTSANTLTQYNMKPAGEYGILEEYSANVSILKLDITPLPPSQGGIVQYYIVATNTGNITLNPVELTDTLPTGFTFNSTDTPGYTLSGNNVSWGNVGPLSPGSPVTILLNASVDAETPSGNYSNTANAQGTPPNGDDVFASDTAYTGVNSSAINLVKTASNYSVIMHGNLTFVLNITNSGEVNITTLVSDALPNGVSLIDALPEPGSIVGQTLYWNTIGILQPGEHFEIVYTASMDSGGIKTNNAVATGTPPNGANATDSDSVTINVPFPPENHGTRGVPECITNADCSSCYSCNSHKCILASGACAADSDCSGMGAGYSCEGCGCVAPECSQDSDCARGYTCLNYKCKQPECWENSDCSNGKICDSFKCVEKTPEGTPPWPTENSTTGIPVKPEEKPPLITPEQPKPIQVVSTTVPLVGAQQKPVSPFPESAVYLLAAVLAMIIIPGAYMLLKLRHEHARHGRMGH